MRRIHYDPSSGEVVQVESGMAGIVRDGCLIASVPDDVDPLGMRVVDLQFDAPEVGPAPMPTAVLVSGAPLPRRALAHLMVRALRNAELASTDRFVAPDYPVDDATRAQWTDYRAALRDLGRHQTVDEMIAAWPPRPDGGPRAIDNMEI